MRRPRRCARAGSAVGLALALTVSLHAQNTQQGPLTLDAAIARAIEANRTLIAARLQRPVSVASVGVAGERPNPEVSFEAEKEAPRRAIAFSQPIELGGKRARRIDLAEAGVASADAAIALAMAEVQTDVRRAYFTIIAADQRLALANETRALALRVRDTAATRAAAGDVPQLEVVQTQIGLSNADQDVSAARGEAAAARVELNVLMGQPPDAPVTPADTLTAAPLPALADLLARVSEANPSIVQFDRRLAEQTARINLARALKMPDLNAGGAVTYLAMPEFNVGWRASAGITLPLFTTHKAGVTFENAELTRLRAERDAALASTSAAIAAAHVRASAAREQMTRYETEILPNLLRSEQMVQDGYSAGQTPLVTLLAALQQTREGRLKGLQAALDYQLALADLERAVGTRIR